MTPHQLAKRRAQDVLVCVDVDGSAMADLVVATSVHVEPGGPFAAEEHALVCHVQDQQLGAVTEADPGAAERPTDGCLVVWAQPLIAEHAPQRGVQPAAVGQVGDPEAGVVEARTPIYVHGEVVNLALVHGEGGGVERRGLDGGRPPDMRTLVIGAHTLGASEAEGGRHGRC